MDIKELHRLWHDDTISTIEIRRRMGLTARQLARIGLYQGWSPRPTSFSRWSGVDPSPEEIMRLAEECRERRGANEKARDEQAGKVAWSIPSFAFNGRDCSFSEAAW